MSSGIHEAGLSSGALDLHRALASLEEELEAVDWYNQRIDVTRDEALRGVLAHNRDEELEHAVMTLEWLRRSLPQLDAQLRRILFQPGDIAARAEAGGGTGPGREPPGGADGSPGWIAPGEGEAPAPTAGQGLGLGNLQRCKAGGDGHDGYAQAGMGAHHG